MAEQASEPVANYSNCFAALYAAAGWAADSRGNQMQANANTAENQIGIELKEFGNSWTVHLSKSAQYISHPQSFQSSWMAASRLRSMILQERNAMQGRLEALQNSFNWYQNNSNSDRSLTWEYPSLWSSIASDDAHEAQLAPVIQAYQSQINAGGDLSTAADLTAALQALEGKSFQSHPLVNTSKIATSYLNHNRGSEVTIPEYENHIASLVRREVPGSNGNKVLEQQVLADQALLNQAKTAHNNDTTEAQQGVQQAQNAVTQDANMATNDIQLIQSLNAMLEACSVGRGL